MFRSDVTSLIVGTRIIVKSLESWGIPYLSLVVSFMLNSGSLSWAGVGKMSYRLLRAVLPLHWSRAFLRLSFLPYPLTIAPPLPMTTFPLLVQILTIPKHQAPPFASLQFQFLPILHSNLHPKTCCPLPVDFTTHCQFSTPSAHSLLFLREVDDF